MPDGVPEEAGCPEVQPASSSETAASTTAGAVRRLRATLMTAGPLPWGTAAAAGSPSLAGATATSGDSPREHPARPTGTPPIAPRPRAERPNPVRDGPTPYGTARFPVADQSPPPAPTGRYLANCSARYCTATRTSRSRSRSGV
ncbi:hypothetical protein GCM10009759_73930 [Kitasatospora saccharophila]|uniref:Uncharacterized protein n=1 Tax=Kitasatospora saccharophila TaxID=407973 RepID=A0ABP5K0M0_9ACTN